MNKILLTIGLVVVGCSTQLWAQNTPATEPAGPATEKEDKGLSKEMVQIVEREIALDSAERLYSNAAYAVPREVVIEKQTYKTQDYKLLLHSLDHKIKVFTVKTPPLDDLHKHYVRAGFGNYMTPYLDVFTGSGRDTKLNYAIRYKHLSSKNGPVDGKASGNSDNLFDAGVKYHLSKKTDVNFNLMYQRLAYHFYGFKEAGNNLGWFGPNDEAIPSYSSPTQFVNSWNSYVALESKPFDDLEVGLNVSYNRIKDAYEAKENEIGFGADAIYSLSENSKLSLDLDGYLTKRSDSSSISRNYFSLAPKFHQSKGKLLFDLGAKVVYENDTLSDRSNIHVYPIATAEYKLTDHISPYVGLGGDMIRNTYGSMLKENPWLANDVVLLNSNKAIEFYGGVKGNLNEKLGFNTRLAYQNYKWLNFFTDSPTQAGEFNISYEEGNTTVVNFIAELEYEKLEVYSFGISAEVNSFNLSDLDAPFYRPTLEARAFGEYKLKKKLNLNADIFYISGLKALDNSDGSVVKLSSIVDLNLGAEYLITSRLSAFLELNNLLSKNYTRYQYYPVRGFNMMLGATYSF